MRLCFLLLGLMLGCNTGELEAKNAELEQKVSTLETEKGRLEKENDALHAEVRKAREALANARKQEARTSLGLKDGQKLYAKLSTSKGDINCELWPDVAPTTVLNFVGLAEGSKEWTDPNTNQKVRKPLYDGTIFHRVIPKFMIQGGDPLGNGTGGPGYEFEDETTPDVTFSEPGLLAMANAGPNTNGSQFFITDRAKPNHLNGKHTIFGKCSNLDVVQSIAEVERGAQDKPKVDVVIKKVMFTRE